MKKFSFNVVLANSRRKCFLLKHFGFVSQFEFWWYFKALEVIDVLDKLVVTDDHHPPPTFTPPELPKKVHVRGILIVLYTIQTEISCYRCRSTYSLLRYCITRSSKYVIALQSVLFSIFSFNRSFIDNLATFTHSAYSIINAGIFCNLKTLLCLKLVHIILISVESF